MMSRETKIRFGLWYDFRNPAQWREPPDRLYRDILDQIAWGENNGFDDVWLSEHHFIEDGYLPSILPVAAAIAARTNRIRIASGVLLMPFHNRAAVSSLASGSASNPKSLQASAYLRRSAARAPTNRSTSSAAPSPARRSPSRATSSTSKTSG
jgi:hypothetical protein